MDIKGAINDWGTKSTNPTNAAYVHCGIHILQNLVAKKAIVGVEVVVRTLNTEQASLWQAALRLPRNLALASVRVGTGDSIARSPGDFEIWDSVAANGHEHYTVWDFFRVNVGMGFMKCLKGVVFLGDRAIIEVDPKPFYLNQLFLLRGTGSTCTMDVTDLEESEHCDL